MTTTKQINPLAGMINVNELKHLRVEYIKGEYVITLIDSGRHELLKGFGKTLVDAINDMHHNLL